MNKPVRGSGWKRLIAAVLGMALVMSYMPEIRVSAQDLQEMTDETDKGQPDTTELAEEKGEDMPDYEPENVGGGTQDGDIPAEITGEDAEIILDSQDDLESESYDIQPGAYAFGTDWRNWQQNQFFDQELKSGACRVVAYAKALVQMGAVPMSAVENGTFNPGILYDWAVTNSEINEPITEANLGQIPVRYAASIGSGVSVGFDGSIYGSSDEAKLTRIKFLVNQGYTLVLCGYTEEKKPEGYTANHFVCVDSEKTRNTGEVWVTDSSVKNGSTSIKATDMTTTIVPRLYRIMYYHCSNGGTIKTYDPPRLKSVNVISRDLNAGTYTVEAVVYAEQGVARVQFPTWTVRNGQDDLLQDWGTNGAVSGQCIAQNGSEYTYRFNVDSNAHNGERGTYQTDVYAWGSDGKMSNCLGVSVNLDKAPEFEDGYPLVSSKRLASGTYQVITIVKSSVGIESVSVSAWTDANGTDDLVTGKSEQYQRIGNTYYYRYTVTIADHNQERGLYHSKVVVRDTNGNEISKNLSTTDFRARNSGTCGDNLTWTLSGSDDDLTLTITGTGEMKWTLGGSEGEYGAAYESIPWVVSQRNIRHLSLPEGLTRIKAYAFANCPLEEIEIPSTVQYIENQAFRFTSCGDKARSLILNGTVDRLYIMDNAFCDAGIKDIYFKEDAYYSFSAVDAVRESSIFWSGSEAPADYTDYWGNLHTFKVSNGYCYHTVISHSHSFDEDVTLHYLGSSEKMQDHWTSPQYKGYASEPIDTKVRSVSLSTDTLQMKVGDSVQLTAAVEPVTASDHTVTWASANAKIAQVTQDGLVTARAKGTTKVTVTSKDGNKKVTCTVTVSEEQDNLVLRFTTPGYTGSKGDEIDTEWIAEPAYVGDSLIFSSENPDVATVDQQGHIIVTGFGSTTITVQNKALKLSDRLFVTSVIQKPLSLRINRSSLTLSEGYMSTLSVSFLPKECGSEPVVWSSSDENVAAVINGTVWAQDVDKQETAVITATSESGLKSACLVTVNPVIYNDVLGDVRHNEQGEEIEIDDDIWAKGFEDSFEYTGSQITQNLRIYNGGRLLQENTDYTLKYANNVNAANATDGNKAPSVTINMKGQFSGSKKLTFSITQIDLNDPRITVDDDVVTVANNKTQKPGIAVYYKNTDGKTMKLSPSEVTVLYNVEGYDYMSVGEQKVSLRGSKNYKGTKEAAFRIVSKDHNLNKAKIVLDRKSYEFSGTAVKPGVRVVIGGEDLSESLYVVSYSSNESSGTGMIEITASDGGKAAGYYGKLSARFTITGDRRLTADLITNAWQNTMVFSEATSRSGNGFRQNTDGLLKYAGTPLTQGQDYEISYKNNQKVGTATATFVGKGRYQGSFTKTFMIRPDTALTITPINDCTYKKTGVKPLVTVKDGAGLTLALGKDYKVSYVGNTKPGTATVKVNGINNFKGYNGSMTFTIGNADLSAMTATASDKVYSTKKNAWKAVPVIMDEDGKKLVAGKDYEQALNYHYSDMSTSTVPNAGTTVYITITGKGYYAGSSLTTSYRICENDIKNLYVVIDPQVYSGDPIEPDKGSVHLYLNKAAASNVENELPFENYEIVGYANNLNSGTGKLTLRGLGSYGGTRVCTFKINKKTLLDSFFTWF